jgi:hypothetical protein
MGDVTGKSCNLIRVEMKQRQEDFERCEEITNADKFENNWITFRSPYRAHFILLGQLDE